MSHRRLSPARWRTVIVFATILATLTIVAVAAENSAVIPSPQRGMEARHREKVAAARAGSHDLLLIGDSITHNLDLQPYQAVWEQFYGPRHALNLGYSGGRTENILWNLQNGELDGQSPKVAVLLIGTNNSDDANYAVVHTPKQIFEGTQAIVQLLRKRLPLTKIVLLRIFPRTNVYRNGRAERGSARRRLETNLKAGELVAHLADGRMVYYVDINYLFVRLDGSIDRELMPDLLHPSPQGALLWAKAMEPTLSSLMGDRSRDPSPEKNTALIPVPKLENDSYDWYARHQEVLRTKDTISPEVVMIGDSITHFWGGPPHSNTQRGPKAWKELFGDRSVVNLGFGWDRTQNVLWRLDHGEFDGLHPRFVVLNIGTNNFSATPHARANTPAEVAAGVRAICIRIRAKSPETKIIVMDVFPRGKSPDDRFRAKISELNGQLVELGKTPGITVLDIGDKFLLPSGAISQELMSDFCHPTENGYAVWAAALKPLLRKL